MRVLIIGGTGLISRGIIKHLQARKADITMVNRGKRLVTPHGKVPGEVKQISLDRREFGEFERAFADQKFDVVIDMICYRPDEAESDVRAFSGRCGHFIFCSTVCTYGVKVPPGVLVDENFPQEPISEYGRNKVACENIFRQAHEQKRMPTTIIRPSHTYGPELALIDNIEADSVAWDRIDRGLPILCAGDGLGLWVSTHRDDCGKLFAYAAMNSKTFGQSYNATRDQNLTWREYLQQAAAALGKPAKVLFMPADWIIAHDSKRFSLLREITQFHGAYDSSKGKRDVPEFQCEIDFRQGAKSTLDAHRARGTLRSGKDDTLYDSMVDKAIKAGIKPVTL